MVVGFPPNIANKDTDISHGEAVYRKFLMDYKVELLHNVNESIKSVDESLSKYEAEAWEQYELLNQEAPVDSQDDAIAAYRYTKISQIAEYLNEVTEDLYTRKAKLIQTRAQLFITVKNISEDFQIV